jgi:hypothetical protein
MFRLMFRKKFEVANRLKGLMMYVKGYYWTILQQWTPLKLSMRVRQDGSRSIVWAWSFWRDSNLIQSWGHWLLNHQDHVKWRSEENSQFSWTSNDLRLNQVQAKEAAQSLVWRLSWEPLKDMTSCPSILTRETLWGSSDSWLSDHSWSSSNNTLYLPSIPMIDQTRGGKAYRQGRHIEHFQNTLRYQLNCGKQVMVYWREHSAKDSKECNWSQMSRTDWIEVTIDQDKTTLP